MIVTNQFQRGLLIDLHGHGHAIQRLELGYLLSASNLRSGNNFLNGPVAIENSSIRHLALHNKNEYRHAELLNGQESLGGFLKRNVIPRYLAQRILHQEVGRIIFPEGIIQIDMDRLIVEK